MTYFFALYFLCGFGTLMTCWDDVREAGEDMLVIVFVCLVMFPAVWAAAVVGDVER